MCGLKHWSRVSEFQHGWGHFTLGKKSGQGRSRHTGCNAVGHYSFCFILRVFLFTGCSGGPWQIRSVFGICSLHEIVMKHMNCICLQDADGASNISDLELTPNFMLQFPNWISFIRCCVGSSDIFEILFWLSVENFSAAWQPLRKTAW